LGGGRRGGEEDIDSLGKGGSVLMGSTTVSFCRRGEKGGHHKSERGFRSGRFVTNPKSITFQNSGQKKTRPLIRRTSEQVRLTR